MAHRGAALCIFGAVAWLAGAARSRFGAGSPVRRLAAIWFGAILLQVILGAATIWTNKAADLATAHVAVGALSLVIGSIATLVAWRASGQRPLSGAAVPAAGAGVSPANTLAGGTPAEAGETPAPLTTPSRGGNVPLRPETDVVKSSS
jgi:cytochrome c oxidase assembly protein subunit 15